MSTILALVVGIGLVALTARGIVVVREGEVGVVFRLGRFLRRQRPGPTFVVPLLDDIAFVRTSPRRYLAAAAGFTSDGARATLRLAFVVDVVDPVQALRFSTSLRTQACDAVALAAGRALSGLTAAQVAAGDDALGAAVTALAEPELEALGLRLLSVRPGPVTLPPPLVGALAGITVAAYRQQGAVVDAQTARLVSYEATLARTESLTRLDRVARRLDERTLDLERLEVLRVAAANGGQFSIVTGLDDAGARPALALPPPRLRDAS